MAREASDFSIELDLQGVLTTAVRAQLVTEFLKDIMYQRQQLSMPFEQIRKDVVKSGQSSNGGALARPDPEGRKKKILVDGISELASIIQQVFALPALVRSVLIVLGPSTVSAKESYLLRFPVSVFDGHILSLGHCKAALFKHMVLCPFFDEVTPPLSVTKLSVFVEVQDIPVSGLQLLPKPGFRLPKRSSRLDVDFVCHSPVVSGDLSRAHDADFDISGVEPLNQSAVELDPAGGCLGSPLSMEVDPRWDSPMVISDTLNTPSHDFVWYQVPANVQGYREKLAKNPAMVH